MELGRRNRISDLYHAALARTAEERGAFLNEACDGDDDLRQDVESLLGYESASSRFLETPAVAVVGGASVRAPMVNRQVGSYTIVAPLGAGGMGEVYRARDTKLGRDVAIKILPPHFTTDPERRARFAREARLLATLNHPHIGAIYGLEEAAGVTALVLELVEGPTLADRLARGRLPVAEALAIARQIAEALDEAHEKGIVHRDLKPANIVLQGAVGPVAGDVRAKVLDFGLAKTIAADPRHDLTQSPSSLDGTAEGRILGTPAYMSPEQARGQAVDKRTDVWAFGCVLYEMLAGRRAFDADTISDTFVSILERDPDWAALPAETPAAIRILLDRCLRKDPRKRLHDIADALIELNDGAKLSASTGSPAHALIMVRRNRPRAAWITGAFVIGVLLTAGTFALLSRRPVPSIGVSSELGMTPPPGLRLRTNVAFALAPDGKHMAMVAGTDSDPWALWVRSIESGDFRRLPGTEDATTPFWSPDSRRIGFIAGLKLKTIAVDGGGPSEVCDAVEGASGGGGSWNRDGIIVFKAAAGHLQKVSAGGGTPTPVTTLGEGDATHRWPWFLPDGQHFLFLALGQGPSQLRIGSLSSTESAPLGAIRTDAMYASGHLLFGNDALMAQPFDLRSRQLTGEPISLNVHVPVLASQSPGKIALTASETGLLAFRERVTIPQQLTWVDRKGNPVGTVGEPGGYRNLRLSSDDREVAFSSRGDIWVINLARDDDLRRITTNLADDGDPIWSSDGKDIIFNSNPTGSFSLFQRPSDASGSDELLSQVEKGYDMWAPDWSLDSRWVILCTDPADLAVLDLQGTPKLTTWKTPSDEGSPGFSPNGRFVVFDSNKTDRREVYVRPFPYEDRTYKISQDGGWSPRWRSDGEIFFLSRDGWMMSARVSVDNISQRVTPQMLFKTDIAPGNFHPFDVTKDGQRFLIPLSTQAPALAPITVMTNWTARLAR